MNESKISFKFPLVDHSAAAITSGGVFGAVGFSDKYAGHTTADDELVVALRAALNQKTAGSKDAELIRSFAFAWLKGRNHKLGHVVAYSVEIQNCIGFLSQIGFLDRTANTISNVAVGVAGIALTWELFFWEDTMAAPVIAGSVVAESAMFGLSQAFESKITKRFGEPGTPVKRSDFDIEPILVFLQCCQTRNVITRVDGDKALVDALVTRLDAQIFSLFLLNSRQLEGLACMGASEATAAVAAHAAIALGLSDVCDRLDLLEMLQRNIVGLDDETRRGETESTLRAIRRHVSFDTNAIERQLSRQLISSATTEALDLAVVPLRASLQLMSLVAGGMESVSPGQYGSGFSMLKRGIDSACSVASSSPDVLANALSAGISAEAWARHKFDKVCDFLVLPKSTAENGA
ncbi:hypothetical protein [Mariniblastus fucicola]|nr:hypothetical protein [Mariniblastus fucicola]